MARALGDVGADPTPVGPPRSAPESRVRIDVTLVVDVLGRLAGAATSADVAAAGLPLLLEVAGVRGAAVVVRDGVRVVVLGSAGYDCGPMSPGGVFPLDAGLPMTEAVRTRRLVVQGSGPSWVAAPFGRGMSGALLLSLDVAPPEDPEQRFRLTRIARAIGDGLRRARDQERALGELAAVSGGLALPVAAPPGWEVAVRAVPQDGVAGGDVVLALDDDRGGTWLLAADVCGMGLAAAVVARSVHGVLSALTPFAADPGELLARADRALRTAVEPGRFVTAIAVRVTADRIEVAGAGHPPPLLLSAPSSLAVLDVDPGPPLALEVDAPAAWPVCCSAWSGDDLLLLHTDGLTDRRGPDGTLSVPPVDLVRGLPAGRPDQVADAVLAAAERVGPAADDVTLLVARRAAPV